MSERELLDEIERGMTPAQREAMARFVELAAEEPCAWLERIPPPDQPGASARRFEPEEVKGFARLAATFLVRAAAHGLDPIGFPLGREVELDVDPAPPQRLEIAAWARRAGRVVRAGGPMFVVAIPVAAPWPLRLQLLFVEPGHGRSGALALLLRLAAPGLTAPAAGAAPPLLWLPGEAAEARGARFERWLPEAHAHVVRTWRPWM